MSDRVQLPPAAEEIAHLRARLKKLAEEKSYLQLIIHLIERLNPLAGLETLVHDLLHAIVETIGGTNIKLYRFHDGAVVYTDFLGNSRMLDGIDDPMVAHVAADRNFLEIEGGKDDALLRGDIVPGAWTWCFPLAVGADLMGVVKIENLHISGASLRSYLPILFSHVALILAAETRNHSRRQALEALLAAEERFRATFEQAAVGIAHMAPDGRWLRVNEKLCQILGYSRDELLARASQDVTHPDDLGLDRDQAERLLRGDATTCAIEKRCMHRDGRLVWITLTMALVRDAAGAPDYFISVIQDIGAQKDLSDRLARNEENLRRAQAVSHTGSWYLDIIADRLEWSDETYRLFGRQRDRPLAHRDFLSAVHPDDLGAVTEAWQAALHGSSFDVEHRIIAGGHLHWVRERADISFDAEGVPVSAIGTTQDVTERKVAEERLRESEFFLHETQRVGKLGGWKLNPIRNELMWTEEVFDLVGAPHGLQPNLAQGLEYFLPPYRDSMRKLFETSFSERRPFQVELELVPHHGEPIWIELRGAPNTQDRAPDYLVGTVMDISERKETEARIQRTIDELTRSNSELERFAYIASHDLQEPVRTVVSFSQLLARELGGSASPTARECLSFITTGARRMQDLVQDLLVYSRVSSRETPLVPVDCSLAAEAAQMNLDTLIRESGARLEIGAMPTVLGNYIQIVELFQNLIANAIKFARAGVPAQVSVSAAEQEGEWLFKVADNGIGIPREYQEQIFVIFRRLHPAHVYPGTGLGLALCKRIVERHRGRIWVESEPGQGSTFHFTLPKMEPATETFEVP